MNVDKLKAYELKMETSIPELDATGYLLSHKKTKARIAIIENKDDNKVFNIGFRTPPIDSTGIPHIVEHTVLCGSRKFPVKDPFAELDKGSLNTFLNAMTYPDKTIYPVASVNDKDFKNLMDVYLDAVFHPNIYTEEKIFKQEGWHYELDSVDGDLIYNGVVFNEMKGAFSSADERLDTLIQKTLFPDTEYGVVSGGDPKVIPELTREAYLDFHKRYYHPSNSYIYLYGDMDFEEKLDWIDREYLSEYDYLQVESKPKLQTGFSKMVEATDYYPVTDGESADGKTCFAYAAVCGDTLDPYMYQAFQVLEYALVEAIGAPVKEALTKAGIGTEIEGGYSEPFMQPFFQISAKNASDDRRDDFINTVKNTLKNIVETGINKQSLRAAINAMEFQFREADFGRFPKGLMYGITMYDSWLYDDEKPFIHLQLNDTFKVLRERIETNYYEELIDKYLLNNPHSIFVTLKAKEGMATAEDEAEKAKLRAVYDSLNDDEKKALIEQTLELKKYQEEPSTPEELATIPMLKLSDIGTDARKLVNDEREIKGIKTLYHDIFTNGISYVRFSFDITDLEEYAPYIGLIADVLGVMDTDSHDKLELSNELLLHSGGYGIGTDNFTERFSDNYCIRLEMTTKVLFSETEYMMGLLAEIIDETHLDDKERLKEIIAERRSGRLASMQAAGHSLAMNRASAYLKKAAHYMEKMKGLEYYDFLCELEDNFDAHADNLVAILSKVRDEVFSKKRLLIDITTTEEGYKIFENSVGSYIDVLDKSHPTSVESPIPDYTVPELHKNEGIAISSNVQYVARAGSYRDKGVKYSGSFRVLKTLLSYEYLWNEVRVKGGAYGIMCGFMPTGVGYFVSYRDPNLTETNEIYKTVAKYLRNLHLSDRDLEKFIIGSVRDLDAPLTPKAEGSRSYTNYMMKTPFEELQRTRDELLSTTNKDLQKTADMVEAFLSDEYICVVGAEEKVKGAAELFGYIRTLK